MGERRRGWPLKFPRFGGVPRRDQAFLMAEFAKIIIAQNMLFLSDLLGNPGVKCEIGCAAIRCD